MQLSRSLKEDAQRMYDRAGVEASLAHEGLMKAIERGADDMEMRPLQRMLDSARAVQLRLLPLLDRSEGTVKSAISLKVVS